MIQKMNERDKQMWKISVCEQQNYTEMYVFQTRGILGRKSWNLHVKKVLAVVSAGSYYTLKLLVISTLCAF